MLLGMTVTNALQQSLYLSLSEPEGSGFIIRSIDGLGSPTSNISMTEYATIDGSRYNNARSTKRSITLKLDYMAKPTIEHSRRLAYQLFPVKGRVELKFHTDLPMVYTTYGYVESNNPNIFSQKSGCTISILCPDPFFHAEGSQSVSFNSVDPAFEFPFENPVGEQTLIVGEINTNLVKDIYYDADQPVGLIVRISLREAPGDLTIRNATTNDEIVISSERVASLTGSAFQEDDIIVLSTVKGNKYITLSRVEEGEEVLYNILGAIESYTSWLILNPGYNTYVIQADQNSEYVDAVVVYDLLYEGI